MIAHTYAFKRLKDDSQEILDFVVLTSYAVPFLKHKLRESESTTNLANYNLTLMPFKPDNFSSGSRVGKIRDSALSYKAELAKTLRITTFSFFESYVGDVLAEIVAFHNGAELATSMKVDQDLSGLTPNQDKQRRKLQEPPKRGKEDKYYRSFAELSGAGVRFPHHAFMRIGVARMQERARNYKSVEIPDMLNELLGLELDATDREAFHLMREARNRIAHGRPQPQDTYIGNAIADNRFTRSLALKIDRHAVKYWLLTDPVSFPYAVK